MTGPAPHDIAALAERLCVPIPEAFREGVADAFARLLEQAALVMAAETTDDPGGDLDFVP
ncbi:MAG TPA: hypothetical protein VH722_19190 [Alphaproteobacteria bacterium]|jgi:hypothetical protein|nr:hypothetical protein [Alphaproteobacteria bacterium]